MLSICELPICSIVVLWNRKFSSHAPTKQVAAQFRVYTATSITGQLCSSSLCNQPFCASEPFGAKGPHDNGPGGGLQNASSEPSLPRSVRRLRSIPATQPTNTWPDHKNIATRQCAGILCTAYRHIPLCLYIYIICISFDHNYLCPSLPYFLSSPSFLFFSATTNTQRHDEHQKR